MIKTEKETGFNPDDIIVYYATAEEVPEIEMKTKDDEPLYIPYWVCIDMVTETRGIMIPIGKCWLMKWDQMAQYAADLIASKKFACGNNGQVYAKHCPHGKGIPAFSGVSPFRK